MKPTKSEFLRSLEKLPKGTRENAGGWSFEVRYYTHLVPTGAYFRTKKEAIEFWRQYDWPDGKK